MTYRVVQSLDAIEIIGIQSMLGAHPGGELGPKIPTERSSEWIQSADTGCHQPSTTIFQHGAQVSINNRMDHHSWAVLDLAQDALKLSGGPDQRINMLDGQNSIKARADGLGDRIQRFSCRVRNEMHVKIDCESAGCGHFDT